MSTKTNYFTAVYQNQNNAIFNGSFYYLQLKGYINWKQKFAKKPVDTLKLNNLFNKKLSASMVIGGSKNSVTLNIKLFEETINGWWLQTTVTKSSVLDAVASLGPPAVTFLLLTTSNCKIWRCCYYCRHYYFLINLFTINLLSMVA